MKRAQADVLGEEKLMRGKVEMEMVLEMVRAAGRARKTDKGEEVGRKIQGDVTQ